eukprot:8673868-Prorocentrum_lima.AAC.1
MTSSLVGSEMCIRDSHSLIQEATKESKAMSHAKGLLRQGWPRPAAPLNCLLYTSDAADDM